MTTYYIVRVGNLHSDVRIFKEEVGGTVSRIQHIGYGYALYTSI